MLQSYRFENLDMCMSGNREGFILLPFNSYIHIILFYIAIFYFFKSRYMGDISFIYFFFFENKYERKMQTSVFLNLQKFVY